MFEIIVVGLSLYNDIFKGPQADLAIGSSEKDPTENLSSTQGTPTGRYSSYSEYTTGSCSKANIYCSIIF
jgi:hypothetical protein